MNKIKFHLKSHLSSLTCFLVMPVLMLLLIGAFHLGYLSQDTEIPSIIASVINWRISAKTFINSFFLGFFVCTLITLNELYIRNQAIKRVHLEKVFDVVGKIVVNNIYFWAGNFAAYAFGSNVLDFIQPIELQSTMPFFLLVLGGAIEFLLSVVKRELLRPRTL